MYHPHFHVVFYVEFSTVLFMREGTIPPNFTDLVQHISQRVAPDNIELKDTWFDPDLEVDPSETPSHEPSIAPENHNNMLMLLQSVPHV